MPGAMPSGAPLSHAAPPGGPMPGGAPPPPATISPSGAGMAAPPALGAPPPPPPPMPPGQLEASNQEPPFSIEEPQKTRIVEDRPDIQLFPPENVIFDPNCDWIDAAQSSQYLRIAHPMSADDAWLLVSRSQGQSKKIPFLDTPIEAFRSAVSPTSGPSDSIASRVARNEGTDPLIWSTAPSAECGFTNGS
jgi:hypothetical protein